MFLRRFERRKNGKPHSYWALVESYRTAKGSRQRVVAYLGELTNGEQDGWAKLGSHLDGEAKGKRPQLTLFDPPRRDERRDDEPLLVKLSTVRLERTRDFGDVWLAWGLWRILGLDELLETLIEPGREEVSWATMAAILTIVGPILKSEPFSSVWREPEALGGAAGARDAPALHASFLRGVVIKSANRA